ncbi:MAG: YpdA family putative bacillithiol disulfide reductase [Gemmatimonadales bacterium]|nr:YpdA family putative bacillithiol disulfide reductase [Gemmatimonadales bacterium]
MTAAPSPLAIDTDLLVVGAGPCGLAVGVAAAEAGVPCVLLDRRTVVGTLERYPLNMTFFSTPERLEIGGVPFVTASTKPTRQDGLVYYRKVAERFALDIRVGVEATAITPRPGGGFRVGVRHRDGEAVGSAANVVIATGYYDWPNRLGIPGEELPHVSHYFTEGHGYWRRRVVVVGAGNSAVDAALECWRAGAAVTLVHVGDALDGTVKPWVLPDMHNRMREGSIAVRWRTRVAAIAAGWVDLEGPAGPERLPADGVLLMTGYHADTALVAGAGVPVDEATGIPAHDEATMATPVPGLYLAGVIASGKDANRLFIENARGHGPAIVRHVLARRAATAGGSARSSGCAA